MSIRPELLAGMGGGAAAANAEPAQASDLSSSPRGPSKPTGPRRSFRGFIATIAGPLHEDDLERKKNEHDTAEADAKKLDMRDVKRLNKRLRATLKKLKQNELEPSVKNGIARFKSQLNPKVLRLPHYEPKRWALILQFIRKPIKDTDALQAIWRTCPIPMDRNDGTGFAKFMNQEATEREKQVFWKYSLPFMQQLVLSLPNLFGKENKHKLLFMKQRGSVNYTAHQVGAMIACGFFCLHNMEFRGMYEHGLPIDAASQFHNANMRVLLEITRQASHCKFRCIINYFYKLSQEKTAGKRVITLHKHIVDTATLDREICLSKLQTHQAKLVGVEFKEGGYRDEPAPGVLQVIPSSDHPGGHFIGEGNDDEELLLCEYPETFLLILFLEKLAPNEVAVVIGAQHFNKVEVINKGFGLKWLGPAKELTLVCEKAPTRLANFQLLLTPQDVNYVDQYKPYLMQRELARCFTGYSIPDEVFLHKITKVKTGNWGVGSFGGDLELKFALQWIALSITSPGRTFDYYAEEHPKATNLPGLIAMSQKAGLPVNMGYHMILLLSAEEQRKRCSLVKFAQKLTAMRQAQAQAALAQKKRAAAKEREERGQPPQHERTPAQRRSARRLDQ